MVPIKSHINLMFLQKIYICDNWMAGENKKKWKRACDRVPHKKISVCFVFDFIFFVTESACSVDKFRAESEMERFGIWQRLPLSVQSHLCACKVLRMEHWKRECGQLEFYLKEICVTQFNLILDQMAGFSAYQFLVCASKMTRKSSDFDGLNSMLNMIYDYLTSWQFYYMEIIQPLLLVVSRGFRVATIYNVSLTKHLLIELIILF